jgi:hypothetical protein
MAHDTVTLGLWSGRWLSSQGLLWDQYRKRMRKARCVIIGEPPLWMNSSTTKARCSPDQAMVWTENGMNTAVYRRTPHRSIPVPPVATLRPNRGVLSIPPCIKWGTRKSPTSLDACQPVGRTIYSSSTFRKQRLGMSVLMHDVMVSLCVGTGGGHLTAYDSLSHTDGSSNAFLTSWRPEGNLELAGAVLGLCTNCRWVVGFMPGRFTHEQRSPGKMGEQKYCSSGTRIRTPKPISHY